MLPPMELLFPSSLQLIINSNLHLRFDMFKLRNVLLAQIICLAAIVQAQDIAKSCTICNGLGSQECSLCKGTGKWKAEIEGKRKKVECPACNGTETQPCWSCKGTGRENSIINANTSVEHPDGYHWQWCSKCHHHGVICCNRCSGNGKIFASDGSSSACPLCDGLNYILCNECNGSCGWYTRQVKCAICEGNGTLTCSRCNGSGWLPPENVDKAFAEICKSCKGQKYIPHKDCEGRGCKQCKDGKVKCNTCDGHGAVIISPEPKFKSCSTCLHQGFLKCKECKGRGYKNLTEEGLEK